MRIEFSIIIPVYKVEQFLAQCVDSVLEQTYKNYEIVLVDDGSPDNCPQICDNYADKYKNIKVVHKENGGIYILSEPICLPKKRINSLNAKKVRLM